MTGGHLHDTDSPRHILVIGDSSAAWMALAFCRQFYGTSGGDPDTPCRPAVRLSLITNDENRVFAGPVSVLPGFSGFLDLLNVSEPELLAQTHGAFKLANVYRGWAANQHAHIHAFGAYGAPLEFVEFTQVYQRARGLRNTVEELHEFSLAAQAARFDRFQHPGDDPTSIYAGLSYGLRFDDQRFRQWLVNWLGRDVECMRERVKDVQIGAHDRVEAVSTDKHVLNADLVIDCSEARVIAAKLTSAASSSAETTAWNGAVGSDLRIRAIAGHNPGNLGCDLLTAKAIGLESLQPDRQKLSLNLFTSSEQMDAKTLEKFKRTFAQSPWEIKQHDNFSCVNAWRGNCVSLGPAAVNINTPVVSSLDLCWLGLAPLVKYAPLNSACPPMAKAYNEYVRIQYERVKDYTVMLRELAAARQEAFWRVDRESDYSASMINKLNMYEQRGIFPEVEQGPFSSQDQLVLLSGLHCYPRQVSPLAAGLDDASIAAHVEKIRAAIAGAVQTLPDQKHYLNRYL